MKQAAPQKNSRLPADAKTNQAYQDAFVQYFDNKDSRGLNTVNALLRRQQYPTDPGLQYILAYLYVNDLLHARHQNMTIQTWLYRAAKNGSNDAVYLIAYGHEHAYWDFPHDETNMFAYYRLAAENGHMYAQYRYGLLLLKNEEELRPTYHTPKELDKQHEYALNMLASSAQQGYRPAVEMLGYHSQEQNQADSTKTPANTNTHPVNDLTNAEMLVLLKEYFNQLNQTVIELLSAQGTASEDGVKQILNQLDSATRTVSNEIHESQQAILAAISDVRNEIRGNTTLIIQKFSDEVNNAKKQCDDLRSQLDTLSHTDNETICNQLKAAENAYEAKLSEVLSAVREAIQSTHSKKVANDATYAASSSVQRKLLACYYGELWKKLSQHGRDALVVSSLLAKPGLTDYSWLIIEIVAALEAELKERFFVGYQKYLSSKSDLTINNWPEMLKYYKSEERCYVPSDRFALGVFLDMVDPNAKNYNNNLYTFSPTDVRNGKYAMVNYLPSVWENNKAPNDNELSFFFDIIRKELSNFRNKAAHGDQTNQEDAFTCVNLILGLNFSSLQSSGETKGTKIADVGLMYKLLSWTKPVNEYALSQKTPSENQKNGKGKGKGKGKGTKSFER